METIGKEKKLIWFMLLLSLYLARNGVRGGCESLLSCGECNSEQSRDFQCVWCVSSSQCIERGLLLDSNSSCASNWTNNCNGCLLGKNGRECSGFGICDSSLKQCICASGNSPDCGCNSNTTCNNNGHCDTVTGNCVCNENWHGEQCNKFCDPLQTCSGNGECDSSGNCICTPSYTSPNCSRYDCNSLTTCSSCAGYLTCAWCETENKCIDNKNEESLLKCNSKYLWADLKQCTESCSDLPETFCNTVPYCGFCFDNYTCIRASSDLPTGNGCKHFRYQVITHSDPEILSPPSPTNEFVFDSTVYLLVVMFAGCAFVMSLVVIFGRHYRSREKKAVVPTMDYKELSKEC